MKAATHARHASELRKDGCYKVIGEAIPAGGSMTLKIPRPKGVGHPRAPQCRDCAVLRVFPASEWNQAVDARDAHGKLRWLAFVYDPATGSIRGE